MYIEMGACATKPKVLAGVAVSEAPAQGKELDPAKGDFAALSEAKNDVALVSDAVEGGVKKEQGGEVTEDVDDKAILTKRRSLKLLFTENEGGEGPTEVEALPFLVAVKQEVEPIKASEKASEENESKVDPALVSDDPPQGDVIATPLADENQEPEASEEKAKENPKPEGSEETAEQGETKGEVIPEEEKEKIEVVEEPKEEKASTSLVSVPEI